MPSISLSDFGFGGASPLSFVRPQCPVQFSIFLTYRLVVFLYLLGYFLYDIILSVRPGGYYGGFYFIYLTNWGYILMLVYLFCALWNLVAYSACMRRSGWTPDSAAPRYFFPRAQWFLFNTYTAVAIVISLSFWILLYSPGQSDLYYNINFHLLNGVFALVEIVFTAVVVRLVHCVYPFAFAAAYSIFAGVYYAAGGTNPNGHDYIYPILDFGEDLGKAVGITVSLSFGTAIVHIVLVWGLHKLKLLMFRKCCPTCSANVSDDESYSVGHGEGV